MSDIMMPTTCESCGARVFKMPDQDASETFCYVCEGRLAKEPLKQNDEYGLIEIRYPEQRTQAHKLLQQLFTLLDVGGGVGPKQTWKARKRLIRHVAAELLGEDTDFEELC